MDSNANIELLRGHMDTIILCTLIPNDKYGLEILKEIVDSSQELYTLKQPTLYSALKRLTADGFVDSYEGDISNGRKRVYYALTAKGRKFVTEDQLQWEFSRTIIDKLISDKVFDPVLNDKPFDPSEFRPSTKRTKAKSEEYISENHNDTLDMQNTMQQQYSPSQKAEEANSDLPYGVTSGAFNSSTYNESIIPQQPSMPIMVAATDKVEDKFHFSSVVSAELRNKELISRGEYQDKPASIDSLYDSKWEKTPIDTAKNEPIKVVNEHFAFTDFNTKVNRHEIDEVDRKTAASMLYAPEFNNEQTRGKSELPESLTHYDLDIKPKTADKKLINTTYEPLVTDSHSQQHTSAVQIDTPPKYVDKRYIAQQDIVPTHTLPDEKSVNYISTLGNIFNSTTSQTQAPDRTKPDLYTYDQNIKPPTQSSHKLNDKNNIYIEDMNLAKLKLKLYDEDITLKQYVKSETSNYYVNKYYYSNKIIRDWSFIAYGIFALFCIISYVSTLTIPNSNLGAFLGIMFSGALLPIFTTINWNINKSARKSTKFSYAHTMVTGAIITLILLMAILAISFFAIKINITEIKTIVNPLILPLIALLMIPLDITIFSMLYNSKKYHLR